MRALCKIKEQPHYRSKAFKEGLKNVGFEVVSAIKDPKPDDVVVIWNRSNTMDRHAAAIEAVGGRVIVAENGYCGRDTKGRQYYALALDGHNGSGRWHIGQIDRFAQLRIQPKPFRMRGEYYLVCGQRGIGSATMRSPSDWHGKMAKKIHELGLPVKIRKHPGNKPAEVPLEEDLEKAIACVVWSSASGVKALLNGVPVVYDAPFWICQDAAARLSEINRLDYFMDDTARLNALRRMAWAQWQISEIETGEAFDYLLRQEVRPQIQRAA